ncbi:MAG: hypothetical protein JNM95_13175 [Chitinophagaceae bacterium]|nr:hypothetical protein [Chitinophagaceae bacterium]
MKRNFVITAAVILIGSVLLSSCSAIKKKLNVDIDMTSSNVEFTIPVITTVGTTDMGEQTIPVNIDSIIKANNAELAASNIKSVKLKSCTITLLDGDGQNNFAALQACSASFYSNTQTTPVQLASISDNPDVESYNLTLPVNASIDLKDYFGATSFTYHITGTSRKTTTKELHAKATIRYTLNVGL